MSLKLFLGIVLTIVLLTVVTGDNNESEEFGDGKSGGGGFGGNWFEIETNQNNLFLSEVTRNEIYKHNENTV